MNIESIDINEIHADPANVRRHPERNLASIKASLARFGQQRPIVVDGNGVVRAGNGTLEAARQLGWTEINIPAQADHRPEVGQALADRQAGRRPDDL